MRRFSSGLCLLLALSLLLLGCSSQTAQAPVAKAPEPAFSPHSFDLDQYGQKVENVLILLDASFSMRDSDGGQMKFQTAKEFISRMNQTLPDLDLTAALRSFGHHEAVSSKRTALMYGLTKYTKEGLAGALNQLKYPGGKTPLAEAIEAGSSDLQAAEGRIAVIIISDGDHDLMDRDPVGAAQALKQAYGDRVCIYSVAIGDVKVSQDPTAKVYAKIAGNPPRGRALMEAIAQAGECGFMIDAKDNMSSQAMADFVEKVFLEPCVDNDNDGVCDHVDECLNTPPGVQVDERGCSIACPDIDGDGVCDDRDECKATPKGARSDDRGCWVIGNIEFDFDKSVIKSQFYPVLDEVATILEKNPVLYITVEGHTDSVGSAAYNQSLSERRARSVKDYLAGKGIEADRMNAIGYGKERPIATNETEEGRARNRRVEFTPVYE